MDSDSWYRPDLYRHRQRFMTLMRSPEHAKFLQSALGGIVSSSDSRALELGPGENPLITRFPFNQKVLVEPNRDIARRLKSEIAQDSQVVRADARAIPLDPQAGFDVAVVNEVLTHIPPEERTRVILGLAQRTRKLLVSDRARVSPEELVKQMVAHLAWSKKNEPARITFGKAQAVKQVLDNFETEAPKELARRVDFDELKSVLEPQGFKVRVQHRTLEGEKYSVLTARRTR